MPSLSRAPSWLRRLAPLSGGLALSLLLHVSAHADDLRVGFMPGPYRDAFTHGIVQPNDAVERGQIDANIFQHSLYLNATNKQQGFDLVPVVHVPTPPMGLYSRRHKSLVATALSLVAACLVVSCATSPPPSISSTWRRASCSMTCITKRTELTFLVSVRVPSSPPGLRTLTFTSARIDPSSILPSQLPT